MHWLPFAGPLLVVIVATTLVAGSPKAKPHKFVWDSIKHVYAFGDSYTFVEGELGRVNYRCEIFFGSLRGILTLFGFDSASSEMPFVTRSRRRSF